MLVEIALVIGVPFVAGITIARLWPRVAARAHKVIGPLSFLALGRGDRRSASPTTGTLFTAYIGVVLRRGVPPRRLAMLIGYGIAQGDAPAGGATKAMTFEVGIRNAGLGLLLVFTYFDGLGGMALVAPGGASGTSSPGSRVAAAWKARSGRRARRDEVAA